MVAGSWIHRHSLHNGQCLDGRISDAGKQRVPKGQVLGRHLIRGHQAALKVCPLVPDISDIQQCLSRQLPLDIQSPVLKVRRASIFTVQDVNTTVESDGWIDVRGFWESICRPAVLQDKGRRQSSIGRIESVECIVSLYIETTRGANVAARSPKNAITGTHYRLIAEPVSKPQSRTADF